MDKGVHTFPKGISSKVNVTMRLEFELIYFGVAVQHFSHYATKEEIVVWNRGFEQEKNGRLNLSSSNDSLLSL